MVLTPPIFFLRESGPFMSNRADGTTTGWSSLSGNIRVASPSFARIFGCCSDYTTVTRGFPATSREISSQKHKSGAKFGVRWQAERNRETPAKRESAKDRLTASCAGPAPVWVSGRAVPCFVERDTALDRATRKVHPKRCRRCLGRPYPAIAPKKAVCVRAAQAALPPHSKFCAVSGFLRYYWSSTRIFLLFFAYTDR